MDIKRFCVIIVNEEEYYRCREEGQIRGGFIFHLFPTSDPHALPTEHILVLPFQLMLFISRFCECIKAYKINSKKK